MSYRVNINKKYLNKSFRTDENKIKISKHNTPLHEIIKCMVCLVLKKKDYTFDTECIFVQGGRADIFDLSNGTIYEVLASEKPVSIKRKKDYYPDKEIIEIDAKDYVNCTINEIWEELEEKII